MKIGLLTFQNTTNFGAYLQAIALYKAIEKTGCQCEIIDYSCESIQRREHAYVQHLSWSLKKNIEYLIAGRYLKKKDQELSQFARSIMTFSRPCTRENIQSVCESYDLILVGSDIVWGLDITDHDYTYFLDFLPDDRKKRAFASSVGDCEKNRDDPKVAQLLREFDMISVREDDAAQWVENYTGKRPNVVCDPTMLLTKDEWDDVVAPAPYNSDYVLLYFADNQGKARRNAREYAKKHGYKVKWITEGWPKLGLTKVHPASLSEFLGLIANAQMVFTGSYHGLLFALYYQKKVRYYNRAHKSRMESLSRRLKITEADGLKMDKEQNQGVDYSTVTEEIRAYAEESRRVLRDTLK